MRLHVGYFEDFRAAKTLLIDGDADPLASLAGIFRELAGRGNRRVALHELPFVNAHHGVQVFASQGGRDLGIWNRGSREFAWQRSALGWEEAAEKLDVLAAAQNPVHQYLDEVNEITVMGSRGEYGDDWWTDHG